MSNTCVQKPYKKICFTNYIYNENTKCETVRHWQLCRLDK